MLLYICDSSNHLACWCKKSKTKRTSGKTVYKTRLLRMLDLEIKVIRNESCSLLKEHLPVGGRGGGINACITGTELYIDTGFDTTILRGSACVL